MTIDFAKIIRKRREKMGLTQAALADMALLHRSTIFNYENNNNRMTLDVLMTILDALGLELKVVEQEGHRYE